MEIEEIRRILDNHEERIKSLENTKSPSHNASMDIQKNKRLSINEFILEKRPKSDVQTTLTLAYYLEKMEGYNNFNIEDLQDSFTK